MKVEIKFDDKLRPVSYLNKRCYNDSDDWHTIAEVSYEWDSDNHLAADYDYRYTYDEYGRLIRQVYIKAYDGYNSGYIYEYDDTGRLLKEAYIQVYPDCEVISSLTEYEHSFTDGVATYTRVSSYYNEETNAMVLSNKNVKKEFDKPEGGWSEEFNYRYDNGEWKLLSREYEEFIRIVPGMFNGVRTKYKKEERIGDVVCVMSEDNFEVQNLGNHHIRISGPRYKCQYDYEGTLISREDRKVDSEYAAHTYPGYPDIWYLDNIYFREYALENSETDKWRLERDMRWEYNDLWQWTLYEEAEDYGYGTVYNTRTVCIFDSQNRAVERIQNEGENGELYPKLRTLMTYLGDTNSYNTLEYAYYNRETEDWNSPSKEYEFEWDTSVEVDKMYAVDFYPARNSELSYLPISQKITTQTSNGPKVEVEHYYYTKVDELGAIENISADSARPSGPVTVYTLSGVNVGTFETLDEDALPAGLYLLKQSDNVRKLLKR